MVMQIPSHLPDLTAPLIQRQEAAPVSPVVAVAGVPEVAQGLDSRVALQWAQPVLTPEQGQSTKNTTESLAALRTAPAAAVLLELDAPVSAGELPTQVGRWLSVLAARQQGQAAQWPASPAMSTRPDVSPNANLVLASMQQVYAALAQSPMFAASQLAERVTSKKPAERSVAEGPHHLPPLHTNAEEESSGRLGQLFQALSADSPDAQSAAQCLTTGAMVWGGQLVPGVPAEIRREDAWREDPRSPGQLEKGVSLTLETQLAHLGKLKILAQQWGHDRTVTVFVQPHQGEPLRASALEMQERLADLGVQESRVQEFEP